LRPRPLADQDKGLGEAALMPCRRLGPLDPDPCPLTFGRAWRVHGDLQEVVGADHPDRIRPAESTDILLVELEGDGLAPDGDDLDVV